MKPNLFDFAPSELSQDAFFCWLLSYADHDYLQHELHMVARMMLLSMMQTVNNPSFARLTNESWQVGVSRQNSHIDILVTINQRWVILIESKTNSKHHSNQIQRYIKDLLEKGFEKDHVLAVYLKTGHESRYSINQMVEQVFKDLEVKLGIFNRTQILEILNNQKVENIIFNQYKNYLNKLEKNSRLFLSLSISELQRPTKIQLKNSPQLQKSEPLRRYAWEGFASYLDNLSGIQDYIRDWFWVSSRSGSFLAIDFKPITWKGCYILMAIHEHTIVFGIDTSSQLEQVYMENLTASRAKLRDDFLLQVKHDAEKCPELNIATVRHKGNGVFMKVAQVEPKHWLGGTNHVLTIQDFDQIVEKLHSYYRFLQSLGDDE